MMARQWITKMANPTMAANGNRAKKNAANTDEGVAKVFGSVDLSGSFPGGRNVRSSGFFFYLIFSDGGFLRCSILSFKTGL
ncbi:MAG TPA: hypothetical protein VIT68_01880 [Candidatus Gracilibacteria bacterium]